jgi:hypothetical protein
MRSEKEECGMKRRSISTPKETVPFDPNDQRAVIRASICTGETVAGFKNIHNGRFIEVMVIRTPEDLESFKKIYGITEIRKEY